MQDLFSEANDDIRKDASFYSIVYETRKQLFHQAVRSCRVKNTTKTHSSQLSPEHQALINSIHAIRTAGKPQLQAITSFFERLIIENEKDVIPYNTLLEIYCQRIQNGTDKSNHYLDYDSIQFVTTLWRQIKKNGRWFNYVFIRNLPSIQLPSFVITTGILVFLSLVYHP